jgi:hypothetical protein
LYPSLCLLGKRDYGELISHVKYLSMRE